MFSISDPKSRQKIADLLDKESLRVEETIDKKAKEIAASIAEHHNYLGEKDLYLFAYAHLGLLKYLNRVITAGADVNAKLYLDRKYDIFITPMHFAAGFGTLECVKLLDARGAIYKPPTPQLYFLSPIHYAAAMGKHDCLAYFLEKGIPVDQQSTVSCDFGWNWTPLQMAAGGGHVACIELLIANKANVNLKDPDDYQAVHRAVGNIECLRMLLKNGADPNATNEDGITPLLLAVSEKQYDSVALLLDNKASLLTTSFLCYDSANVLQIAIYKDDLKMAKILLDSCGELANMPNRFGYTALHLVVQEKKTDMLKLLLDPLYKTDLEITVTGERDKGKTALALAQEQDNHEIIDLLVLHQISRPLTLQNA